MTLEIKHIHKNFGGLPTLVDVNLAIEPGELVCLLGPSGCGKTTLLRIVAGLLAPDHGELYLDGSAIGALSARERRFGIVFQSYSLFPHMTVADNIGYGPRLRGASRQQAQRRVAELLEMVDLPQLSQRFPGELSGGQQQRVALARALATEPRVLLLDEPLSALDAQVRAQLRVEIREIQQRLHIPTLMVTHDQEEAMGMADRIVCMQAGRIAQVGTARSLYRQPVNRFVAEFMGRSNLLDAAQALRCWPQLRSRLGSDAAACSVLTDAQRWLCVRPEHLHIAAADAPPVHEGLCSSPARVTQSLFVGSSQRVQLLCQDVPLWCECDASASWQPGDQVALQLAADAAVWVAP